MVKFNEMYAKNVKHKADEYERDNELLKSHLILITLIKCTHSSPTIIIATY